MTNHTTGLYFAEYQHTLTPVAPPSVTRKRLDVKQCTSVFFKVLIMTVQENKNGFRHSYK